MKTLALLSIFFSTSSFAAAYDCHLAAEGAQDSTFIFHSCNTGEGQYLNADAVCRDLCAKVGCFTYYVNTYKPATKPCEKI